MRAIVFEEWKSFPVLKEVERPVPRAGEVLLKVAGAGACHSDVAVFAEFEAGVAANIDPPFVLGHENSGWIEELGPGVTGFEVGEPYLVYGPIGCGHCRACSRGQDTYCEHADEMPYAAVGLGRDGGMAEYVTVPARNLVPLGDSDPVDAAPLSDAGLTPYHAIKLAMPRLSAGGRYALVVGLGGLGQVAVQILRALTGATVIATDTKPEAMEAAARGGAITVPSGPDQKDAILDATHGHGIDAAFDFVGIAATIQAAHSVMARQSRLTVVGIAGGTLPWSFFTNPYECEVTNTYWGTIEELHEVAQMYRAGQIVPAVERFSLDDGLEAYRRLQAGEMTGRAVVVPH